MRISKVTLTGADDSIEPGKLLELTVKFPFVEWGILVSQSQEGCARFPSRNWHTALLNTIALKDVPKHGWPKCRDALSCHVCGKWTRLLLNEGILAPWTCSIAMFNRIQLNFHAEKGFQVNPGLGKALPTDKQYIFQFDGINDSLLQSALYQDLDVVPLFDRSGGAGIVPNEWPKADLLNGIIGWEGSLPNCCGYAGGLGPDNLSKELPRIAEAAGDRTIWIDMEQKLRSGGDSKFDLDKCKDVLEQVAASKWMADEAKNFPWWMGK